MWPVCAQLSELVSLSLAAPVPTEHCTACAMQVQRGGPGRGTASALRALVVGAQLWLCASTEGVRIPGFNAHIPPPPATAAASSAWRRKAVTACTHSSCPLFAAAAGAPGSAGAGVCSDGVWKEASLSALEAGTELPSVRGLARMTRPANWCCD